MKNFKFEQRKLAWDDLHLLLEVSRAGSLVGAAQSLKVSHPTVFRRIRAIESKLGSRLFERSRQGYKATPAVADLLKLAEKIDADIAYAELHLASFDARPAGKVRLTTGDMLAFEVLPGLLSDLRQRLPLIELELFVDNHSADLSRRDADLALRTVQQAPGHLIGRKIAELAATAYCPVDWGDVSPANWHDYPWLVPDDSLSHLASSRMLEQLNLRRNAVMQCNSLLGLGVAAKAGLGLAILPCYYADQIRELRRVITPPAQLASQLWLFSHPDMRKVARISAVAEAMTSALATWKARFEGQLEASQSGSLTD